MGRKEKKQQLSQLKMEVAQSEKKYKELEEKHMETYDKLLEQISYLEGVIAQNEKKIEELSKDNKEAHDLLSNMDAGESVEVFLKNEAYAFLFNKGYMEAFLKYREGSNRSPNQTALYNLIISAEKKGLWIDGF